MMASRFESVLGHYAAMDLLASRGGDMNVATSGCVELLIFLAVYDGCLKKMAD